MMDEETEKRFCELMELPPDRRVAALDTLTGLSPEQMGVVRQMLEDAEAADAYFTGASEVARMLPIIPAIEGEGDMCGPYKLIRKLGEGGFGLVWLAQQEKPLRRTVALKVIKAGMDSAEVLARFDAEKQALSWMEHPNIAKVLDAGLTQTLPADRPCWAAGRLPAHR
jgi:eukaryotic-like serine/threonine-protein kinase